MTTCQVNFEFKGINDTGIEGVQVQATYTDFYEQSGNNEIFVPYPVSAAVTSSTGVTVLTLIRSAEVKVQIDVPNTFGGFITRQFMVSIPNATSCNFVDLVTLNVQT